ncbi:MAG TPA: SufS family cysteine desulfurase, partial [Alphaproteobacteria bacterium]
MPDKKSSIFLKAVKAGQGLKDLLDFDGAKARSDFPIFKQKVNGQKLVYLDTAASAQKPQAVIDSLNETLTTHYANIHRGLYQFSQITTTKFEQARHKTAGFINAASPNSIVFTRSATEAINLVAACWGAAFLKEGDEIVITQLEHHANIVPWQMIAAKTGAKIVVAPITPYGDVRADDVIACFTPKTKMLAISAMSNVLGTIIPVKDIIATAKEKNITTLVDGCQIVMHQQIDVQDLGCDFFTFSGHKIYGPNGVGVLYGREDLLNAMPPYQGGGDMIDSVSFDGTTYKQAPARFEAGTPPIAEVIALGAAIDYLQDCGLSRIAAYEKKIFTYAEEQLQAIPGLRLYGKAVQRASILAFTIDNCPPSDIGMILDQKGICVRVGHHCAMPLMECLSVKALVRAS